MKGFNIIWVYNPGRNKVLMCLRRKAPYKGLYNLVGGKIEPGEAGETAAYRELWEETGIAHSDISLLHLMDFVYHQEEACRVEVWCGVLKKEIEPRGDENELIWMPEDENFFDMERFAGEGNIGHIYELVKINHQRMRIGDPGAQSSGIY